jgi:hypothetical protein
MEDIIYKQGKICKNEEERRERCLASHLRYNVKKYDCIECGKKLSMGNRATHLRTKKHINNMKNYIS